MFGIALVLLLAQNAGPQPAVAPASIEGMATHVGTGESLSKVTVTLSPIPTPGPVNVQLPGPLGAGRSGAANSSATTGTDGKFLFENVKPGNYRMTASSPGYVPSEYGQRGPNGHGMSITLKPGQKMQNVVLNLTQEGSITGRVVDSNGDPLGRALVQAQKVIYQERGRALQTIQSVPADDRGEYRLFWLPPGQYYVSATPFDERARTQNIVVNGASSSSSSELPALVASVMANQVNLANALRDFGPNSRFGTIPGVKVTSTTLPNGDVIDEATVPVYYPSAFDTTKATPIEVRSGTVTGGVNITSTATRVFHIRGTLVDTSTGKAVDAANINLLPRNGPLLPQSISIPQATDLLRFEIAGVVPGSYSLNANGFVEGGRSGLGVAAIDVASANVDDVVIPLSAPAKIQGRFVIEGTATTLPPIGGPRGLSVRLEPQSPGIPGSIVSIGPGGSFTVSGLLPGDYRVLVPPTAGLVPKSIRYDGKDAQADGVHIGSSATGTLEVVMTNRSGKVGGNVLSERQRVPNALVVLVPTLALRQQTNLYQTVQTNADGHFVFESTPPGSYRVFAWDDVPEFAWFDAEFMRNFESKGRDVTIREGDTETLDIPIIPPFTTR